MLCYYNWYNWSVWCIQILWHTKPDYDLESCQTVSIGNQFVRILHWMFFFLVLYVFINHFASCCFSFNLMHKNQPYLLYICDANLKKKMSELQRDRGKVRFKFIQFKCQFSIKIFNRILNKLSFFFSSKFWYSFWLCFCFCFGSKKKLDSKKTTYFCSTTPKCCLNSHYTQFLSFCSINIF